MIGGMRGDRPRLAPTLITLPIVLLCLGLGVWQIRRLHWKEGLIAQREETLKAPPVALPQALAEAQALEWRRVVASGIFLNDKESRLHAIAPQGEAGFDVLTPLRQTGGQIVLVDRGFVPTALADRARRPAGEPVGNVRVAGRLRLAPSSKPGWFLPDNRPSENEWFWVDLPAMAKADGLSEVVPFYIAADATPNPGGWPKGGATLPELPNHHLQYAITWFSLAVAALVIYVLSQRRGADKKDERISRT